MQCVIKQYIIKEYKDRNEYLMDSEFIPKITEDIDGKDVKMDQEVKKLIGRGCLIELYPNKFEKRWTRDEMIKEFIKLAKAQIKNDEAGGDDEEEV